MNAVFIGISASLFTIIIFTVFRQLDKNVVYGLILSGIGFLYVGFSWTETTSVAINILQAIFFLMIAYWGIKKDSYFLIAGYLAHGLWDLVYCKIGNTGLIPPHYDLFCSTYDVIIGLYLLLLKFQRNKNEGRGV